MTSKINDDVQSNPAVQRCCEAYDEAFDAYGGNTEEGDGCYAHNEACIAYRQAMPPLLGVRNIRDFLVCATHGFASGNISGEDYSRFLYAAQVAYSARRARPPKAKELKKTRLKAVKGGKNAAPEPFSAPAKTGLTDSYGIN